MTSQKIDQLLAGYADGDAISHMAVCLRDVFRAWGHPSDIFADPDKVSPALRPDSRPLTDYRPGPKDICFHHYGIASSAADVFLSSDSLKVLVYHNITPAAYFKGYDDHLTAQLKLARARLPDVVRQAHAVWTVSKFNADELAQTGASDVKILPLIFDPQPLNIEPEPLIMQKFTHSRHSLKNILFVGRIAPNKRVENLIQAFAWYHKTINPFSRLLIVGSNRSTPRYYTMLRMLAGDLDVPNVCFEGFASPAGLAAYYRVADLYVCPSEHEGYCLPLVEAMHSGVPVLANNTGGMPEALDGAGVLYNHLSAVELAVLLHKFLTDTSLRQKVLNSQRERMQREYARDIAAETSVLLKPLLRN